MGGPLEGTLAPTAGSFVGYRVRETVAGVGLNEAVGRTGRVDGTARIQRGRIVAARFETDTRTLRSDEAAATRHYGMQPPSVAGVASVRDPGVMEVRLRPR